MSTHKRRSRQKSRGSYQGTLRLAAQRVVQRASCTGAARKEVLSRSSETLGAMQARRMSDNDVAATFQELEEEDKTP